MFIFLTSLAWMVNSQKRQILYHILITRMFRSKNNALQRGTLNRENEKHVIKHPLSAT